MADPFHVHVPCSLLRQHLDLLLEMNLQPEIGLKWDNLDKVSDELVACCRKLKEAGLDVLFHAPFMDLNPGAIDPLVRKATLYRFRQTLDLAKLCEARLTIFHPGFDRWRYGGRSDPWLEASLSFWPPLIEQAAGQGCRLALENIFDEYPQPLATLIQELDSPWLGHCFDIGHWNLFGRVDLKEWLAVFGSRLIHLHLHDNDGASDGHLALGKGNIDFEELFRNLGVCSLKPTVTLEIHNRDGLLDSIPTLTALFDL